MNKKRAGSILFFSLLTLVVVSNSIKAMKRPSDSKNVHNQAGFAQDPKDFAICEYFAARDFYVLYVAAAVLAVGVAGSILFQLNKKKKKKQNKMTQKRRQKRKRKKKPQDLLK